MSTHVSAWTAPESRYDRRVMLTRTTTTNHDNIPLDRGRYRRTITAFGGIFLNVLLWEIVLRRVLGEAATARGRSKRLRRYASRFRGLAVDMGGVMIKLGQFVSARVDVMPPEITQELSGLQDKVPAEDLDVMLDVLERELGRSPDEIFSELETETKAAASLGQVYLGTLKDGRDVAVKIQRPGIERLVATDLAALRQVSRWTMLWDTIRRRADVPALLQEFAATLWEELDYEREADNAERFVVLLADDAQIIVPAMYRNHSTQRVLIMEDVTGIRIGDVDALDAAGVDRPAVARKMLDAYLRMTFEFRFFHADPHPGNLFVHPDPEGDGAAFKIAFVDFGMAGEIAPHVEAGLREMMLAILSADAARMLKAEQMLDILLSTADLLRVEQANREMLEYIQGKSVTELAQMPRDDMQDFAIKYRDLLYDMPFQVPQNFIYLGRALGILSGMCTLLDSDFNPWAPITEYATRYAGGDANETLQTVIAEAVSLVRLLVALPRQVEDVLGQLQRGELRVQIAEQRTLKRLTRSVDRLTWGVICAGLIVSGTVLYVNEAIVPAIVGWGIAGVMGVGLLVGGVASE